MITTNSITQEMNAQVAHEIPRPAGGFKTERDQLNFELARDLRLFQQGRPYFSMGMYRR
jgi:hypothetical protein